MAKLLDVADAAHELFAANAGRTVADIAGDLDGDPVNLAANHAHAVAVRRLLQQRGLAAGLAEEGIVAKVVRRNPDGEVFEKMTFRNFGHNELPRETWETSTLRTDTRCLLIVVFEDVQRGRPIEAHVLVGSFLWMPSADEDLRIERDWKRCREAVAYKLDVPREKETDAVHIGTKGRDGADLEELDGGERVTKQCLCFNKTFVEELLAKYGP